MRTRPQRLAGLVLLLTASCGAEAPRRAPEDVARDYIEAWCRGDGSHTAYELSADELPEPFRRAAHTSLPPQGSELVDFEVQTVGVTGPGQSPELAAWGFDVTEGPERAQGVIAVAVVYTAELADGSIHTNRVVELRPAGSFEPGRRVEVSSADGWAGDWRVLPPAAPR